ncbi:hypothetical protein HYDPIDRAFT_76859, partial [Hydnomerulius pinastri MD-312]
PLILLLHGFPELGYSWRKVLGPLSEAHRGYHVVAPDLRGYGQTHPKCIDPNDLKQVHYDDPIAPFHALNIVEDICALVKALGHASVAMLVGHDFGSPMAGHCVLAHPSLFRSVVFMSAPFVGVERPQMISHSQPNNVPCADSATRDTSLTMLVHAVATKLAALDPPRKHYTAYFSTRNANRDLLGESQDDLYKFLGGYYHMKSGAWEGNNIYPLPSASNPSPTAEEIANDLATLPEYYIMPLQENMHQVISRHGATQWPQMEEDAGKLYTSEFARTGFQGGLNYYRCALSPPPPERVDDLIALAGRKVTVPAAFISGAQDWGVYQTPGAVDKMKKLCGMQSEEFVLIEGAGHWVQQEAPERVIAELLSFLEKV